MKKIQYFDILKKALLMTWDNKTLWIFGLFVFFGSLASNSNVDTSKLSDYNSSLQFINNHPGLIGFISIISFFLIVALFLLRIIGMGAIIKSANDISLYKQLKFKAVFQEARQYLWRILLLELAIGFGLVAIIIVLAIPVVYLFALNAKVLGYVTLVAAVAIILPLVILAYYLRRYAIMHIAIGNFKIKVSLEAAYLIFAKNVKESLLMGLISIGLGLAFIATIITAGLLVVIIFAPFGLVGYFMFAKTGLAVVSILGIILVIVLALVMSAGYEVFLQSAWVFFFQSIAFEKQVEVKNMEKVDAEGEVPAPETV